MKRVVWDVSMKCKVTQDLMMALMRRSRCISLPRQLPPFPTFPYTPRPPSVVSEVHSSCPLAHATRLQPGGVGAQQQQGFQVRA